MEVRENPDYKVLIVEISPEEIKNLMIDRALDYLKTVRYTDRELISSQVIEYSEGEFRVLLVYRGKRE